MNKISIIIPVYNAQSTILNTLKSLSTQQKLIYEIIIINDGSTDKSLSIIKTYFKKHFTKIKKNIINHSKSIGLSASYNDGILNSKGDLVITLHSDVILQKNAISLLVAPFSQKKIIASYHQVIHPFKIWKKYNFWQKVFFDRQLKKLQSAMDGKFDCYRRKELIKIGLFDNKIFFRAGEDGDIFLKLNKIGQVVSTKATILHIHNQEDTFNYKKIIYKQAQYSEAQGALLKKYGILNIKHFIRTFFREILLIGLLFPYIRLFFLILIIIYSFLYTKNTLIYCIKKPIVILLPLINIYLLFISLYFSCKGFYSGQQKI
ncbi:MAG: glycosyltransferase family 2 protein [Candidatus Shapirobacteria bacterium]|nr:glycosyltransferase family 2 protein [Candidatus Shapirobacteria bacterium]MDD4410533.1 glycosyltransferase family 2 protein [Candidatus Shapirobacteria bacterium]